MKKLLTFDFYQLSYPEEMDENNRTFEELVVHANKNKKRKRTIEVSGKEVHFSEFTKTKSGNSLIGDIIHIRMNALPPKVKLNGEINDIDFEKNEGLGEETIFLYHIELNVLVVQRNRFGVPAYRLCRYFEKANNISCPIELNLIIEPDSLVRYNEITQHRKLELSVAGLNENSIADIVQKNDDTSQAIEKLTTLGSPSINLSFTMGNDRKGYMTKGPLRALVKVFQQLLGTSADVRKIKSTGRTQNGEMRVVDLVEDRVIEQVEINFSGKRITYEERINGVKKAMDNRYSQLKAQLKTG